MIFLQSVVYWMEQNICLNWNFGLVNKSLYAGIASGVISGDNLYSAATSLWNILPL